MPVTMIDQFSQNITCCELFLPTSELHHKAGLTSVISVGSRDGQQSAKDSSASVINVSPEGTIRFWPNIANPGIFLESAAGLRGKEFHMVASFPVSQLCLAFYELINQLIIG